MKKGIKKAIVYSLLVGITQFGLATTATIEAAPRSNEWHQQQQQFNNGRHERQENERHYRENLENERHEWEMQRRENENARDWNDRQWRENQRHDNTMNEIFAGVIGIAIGAAIN